MIGAFHNSLLPVFLHLVAGKKDNDRCGKLRPHLLEILQADVAVICNAEDENIRLEFFHGGEAVVIIDDFFDNKRRKPGLQKMAQ